MHDLNLDDALKTFIIESRELLEQMEQSLLKIEQSPEDTDLINAIFRAAHTIKGSAGLFGLDHLVAFTHHAENILDKVRAAELHLSRELVVLLFDVCDHLGILIDHIDAGNAPPLETHARSESLIIALKGHAHPTANSNSMNGGEGVESKNWHISLRFNADVLRNGMDPIAFIRHLSGLGEIIHVATLVNGVPAAEWMEPEDCYLGFEISYCTDANQTAIENAFEFVREDASIHILAPHCPLEHYTNLIKKLLNNSPNNLSNNLPNNLSIPNLGEVFIECTSLTKTEWECIQQIINPSQVIAFESKVIEIIEIIEAIPEKQKRKQIKEAKPQDTALIRVSAEKLDEHINLIGELIIASAGINLVAAKSGAPELLEAASVIHRLVENVRESAMQLRMVQIGATFGKFQRVVRDVSKEIGKDIILEISGAETELDKTVVEKIGDPLTHLVRNAIDHGIESAAVRLERGKPAQGTLRLNAYHDSGSIAIEVSDDGGGLPKKRILAKAIERGLVKPEQILSDNEIHHLIFEPGFSTAEQVNNLSGRGVGMDVVRRNITTLRGTTEIESTEGVGTTIRIRLPLTLAIIDGFLVGVGESSFVIPLEIVHECIELTDQEVKDAQGWDHLNLRGELLPLIHLKRIFNISEMGVLLEPVHRENVVVVHCAGRRLGLVVDALQGEYQTVIRPLGEVFEGLEGISGFTILGTGRVALILDVPSLMTHLIQDKN